MLDLDDENRLEWPDWDVDLEGDLANYPRFQYGKHEVRRAGERLKGSMLWTDESKDEILHAFRVAESWRSSHMFPMRSIRLGLQAQLRHRNVNGFTAARAKRLTSIRTKLEANPTMKLDQMQDLGGCRAVVDDIAGVWRLVEACNTRFRHKQRSPSDYITNPKPDGYRSYHMVVEFVGRESTHRVFDGRRIEIQIRTRLQHSWATAVEAVGLYREENLKAGIGNSQWLRLFKLVSDEFAYTENCIDEAGRSERIREIKSLCRELDAIKYLDHIKLTTSLLQNYILSSEQQYYLINYDQSRHEAIVQPYYTADKGALAFRQIEYEIEFENKKVSAILVNVQTARSLQEAYPGYLGDVSLFVSNLRQICSGSSAVEFTLAPQEVVKQVRPSEISDPAMLRRRYTAWEEESRPKNKRKRGRRRKRR